MRKGTAKCVGGESVRLCKGMSNQGYELVADGTWQARKVEQNYIDIPVLSKDHYKTISIAA